MADDDIEQTADQAAGTRPLRGRSVGTCDWGDCDDFAVVERWSVDHGWLPVCRAHAAGPAAGDPAPAEAVEKVARWLAAQAGWTNPGPWVKFKHRKFYEEQAGEALAAAAPLIVADRDATITRLMKTQAAGVELLKAEVDRLTAELEISRKVRMSHAKQLSKDQAKLAAVAEEIATSIEEAATHCSDGDRTGRARLAQAARIARNHGDTPGGPR